jgi:inorganic triphosphatase YgiF
MSGPRREVEGVLLACGDDPAAVRRRLAGLQRLEGFDLLPRDPERIRDVYLDTGDGDLAEARIAFRVRELDGRPLLTLKADARRTGSASERLELEAPWSAGALQAALEELRRRGIRLPGLPLDPGEPLAVLAGLGLRPTQIRETTRTPRDVVGRDGRGEAPVAELAVDEVAYQLPAGTVRLLEVEVEAKGPGGLATVEALLGALAQAFPHELRPWPYGKLATGRAVERLLAAGRLQGLLDDAGMLRPGAHDLLAEILSQNSS